MSQRSMFSTRARPNQMLKRERERLTKLIRDFVMKLEGVSSVPDEWRLLVNGDRQVTEWEYKLQTAAGPLRVQPRGNWIACRFEDVERARKVLPNVFQSRFNNHSGKWNFWFGRITARDAFEQFFSELHDLVFWWERHAFAWEQHEVLIDQQHGEQNNGYYALLLNGRTILSDHPDYQKMLTGAVEKGCVARLLDWLQEFAPNEWEAVAKPQASFTVVKSQTRNYGYAIQAPPNITWAKGPGNTFGWYRRKRDAQEAADAHNRGENYP
jgi:hypothetical protein